jgi:hypothetical protein
MRYADSIADHVIHLADQVHALLVECEAWRDAVRDWVESDDGTVAERQDARVRLHETWARLAPDDLQGER